MCAPWYTWHRLLVHLPMDGSAENILISLSRVGAQHSIAELYERLTIRRDYRPSEALSVAPASREDERDTHAGLL